MILPTTINPYLVYTRYFSKPWYEETPLLIPLDDLFEVSSKVIFFTYLKQVRIKIGKCIIRLYTIPENNGNTVPATAPEMEIRFIGPRKDLEEVIKNKAIKAISTNVLPKALEWTGILNLAKQLADFAKKSTKLTRVYNLNGYVFMKKKGIIKEKIKEYEEVLKTIAYYDEAIVKLARRICNEKCNKFVKTASY